MCAQVDVVNGHWSIVREFGDVHAIQEESEYVVETGTDKFVIFFGGENVIKEKAAAISAIESEVEIQGRCIMRCSTRERIEIGCTGQAIDATGTCAGI